MYNKEAINVFWNSNFKELNPLFWNKSSFSAFIRANKIDLDLNSIINLKKQRVAINGKREGQIFCKLCGKKIKGDNRKKFCFDCYLLESKRLTIEKYHKDKLLGKLKSKYGLSENKLKETLSKGCQICGFKEALNIHHIDKNRNNNKIENLVVLCLNHHYLMHKAKENK